MGRLIDADNVIAVIDEEIRVLTIQKKQEYKSKIDKLKHIKNVIEYLPTAYDVEKVVEELETGKFISRYNKLGSQREIWDKAIDIVKAGGIDGQIDRC